MLKILDVVLFNERNELIVFATINDKSIIKEANKFVRYCNQNNISIDINRDIISKVEIKQHDEKNRQVAS